MRLLPRDIIHPEDAAAQEQLKAIPLFDQCVKVFLKIGVEQFYHHEGMADKLRLGPSQLPEIYKHLPPICQTLGIQEPELYLEGNPVPNAYALGETRAMVTLHSGLVQAMDEDELQAVLAHECGHIFCQHTLYRTMAMLLMQAGARIFGPLAAVSMPVQLALLYWQRRGELSADRAAAVYLKSPMPMIECMVRFAGGPKAITGTVNIEEYAKQAESFDKLSEKTWDKLLQTVSVMSRTHPFNSIRCRELLRWCETDHYKRLVSALDLQEDAAKCPACAVVIDLTWKFCRGCGAKLPETAVA